MGNSTRPAVGLVMRSLALHTAPTLEAIVRMHAPHDVRMHAPHDVRMHASHDVRMHASHDEQPSNRFNLARKCPSLIGLCWKAVPTWEPSHKGRRARRPPAHHEYSTPGSKSTSVSLPRAIFGSATTLFLCGNRLPMFSLRRPKGRDTSPRGGRTTDPLPSPEYFQVGKRNQARCRIRPRVATNRN